MSDDLPPSPLCGILKLVRSDTSLRKISANIPRILKKRYKDHNAARSNFPQIFTDRDEIYLNISSLFHSAGETVCTDGFRKLPTSTKGPYRLVGLNYNTTPIKPVGLERTVCNHWTRLDPNVRGNCNGPDRVQEGSIEKELCSAKDSGEAY